MRRIDAKTKLFIVIIGFMFIFAFIFTVGYILSNIDPKNKLQGYAIAISFISIFATFVGAYLGAKISGDNASRLAKKENMINDLIRTKESNNVVLEDFENRGIKRALDMYSNRNDLENTFDVNNFVINYFEFKEMFRHFKMNNDYESTFPLLSYDFEELEARIDDLGKELWKYNDQINSFLNNLIKEYGYINHTLYGHGTGIMLYKNSDEYAILETVHLGSQIDINLKNSEVNKAISTHDIGNINDKLDGFKEFWAGFKFKTKDDIRDFVAEYYGGYE